MLEIQKLRERLQISAHEMNRRYNTGNLTKKEVDSILDVWYSRENELRQSVAKIYTAAYAQKCWEETSTKEKK